MKGFTNQNAWLLTFLFAFFANSTPSQILGDSAANPPFKILQQPIGVEAEQGRDVALSVTPEGNPADYNYYWKRNTIPLNDTPGKLIGSNSRQLTIKNLQHADGGSFSVDVERKSDEAALTSASVVVKVKDSDKSQGPARAISSSESQGVVQWRMLFSKTQESPATFPVIQSNPVTRSDAPTLFYWKPAESGIATFDTAGSSFDTQLRIYEILGPESMLTLDLLTVNDNDAHGFFASEASFNAKAGKAYVVWVTWRPQDLDNPPDGNAVLHWSIEVTKDIVPEIRTNPITQIANQTIGNCTVFSVQARGASDGDFSYQWYFEGKPVGRNSDCLAIWEPQLENVGLYWVQVTHTASRRKVISDKAVLALSVGTRPPPPNPKRSLRLFSSPTYTAGPLAWPTSDFRGSGTCCQGRFDRYKVFLYFDGQLVQPPSAFPNPGGTKLTILTEDPTHNIGWDTGVAIRENVGTGYACNDNARTGTKLSKVEMSLKAKSQYRVGIYFKSATARGSNVWFDWKYQ